jgi:hypothetical protein
MRSPVWAAAALALVTAGPLAADVTIAYKLTEDGQPKGTSAQYISSEKLRLEQPDQDMIVEFATGKMTFIDKKKNEYWEVTRAELMSAMEASQKKMDESMAKVPPAMREKMAAMMGGGGLLTVTPGTGSRKIAGYDAHPYAIAMGTMMQQELWAAEIAIPQPAIDARASMTLLANPMMKNAAKAMEEMKKVKGFPLAESTTVKIMGKTKTNGKEATEVKTSAIPASVFALPAGAKKVESPFAKMMKSAQ